MKDLSCHNFCVEDGTDLALDRPLWSLLVL